MCRNQPRVLRALIAALRERATAGELVQHEQHGNERRQQQQCGRGDDHPIGAPAQPSGRESEDDVQGHCEGRRVGEHADAVELGVAGALEHHGNGEEPQGDEQHPQSTRRTPVPPVETDRDRRENQVDLVDRRPARVAQRVRCHQDRK